MSISRKCVPFTPFDRGLSKSTIAIVTAGGVHLRDQEPFNIVNELGDLGYRIIPQDVDSAQLMVTTTTRTPTKTLTWFSRSMCCAICTPTDLSAESQKSTWAIWATRCNSR